MMGWRMWRCAPWVGHWDMQEGGAQRLTWKPGKGRESGTSYAPGRMWPGQPKEGSSRKMAWAGSAQSHSARDHMGTQSKRLGLNYRRGLEGTLKTGRALPANTGNKKALFPACTMG